MPRAEAGLEGVPASRERLRPKTPAQGWGTWSPQVHSPPSRDLPAATANHSRQPCRDRMKH